MSAPPLAEHRAHRPPTDIEMTWLIAQRAAVEALHDRLSMLMGLTFAVLLPLALVLLVIRPVAESSTTRSEQSILGVTLAVYVLVIGLLPTISAVGIASGQFAGEKERGVLTPLLASPASNLAIFGGKVLGAIMPALLYAAVAELVYVLGLALAIGPWVPGLLPLYLSVAMLALVPAVAWFAATVASLVSSRVRTYNAAQQISGLLLMPLWGVVFGLAVKLHDWGPAELLVVVLAMLLVDIGLTVVAAATWRREEVLAHR